VANVSSVYTSRKRVLAAFDREKPDRVPMDYTASPVLHGRVCRALGMPDEDMNALKRKLHVDFQVLDVAYAGPRLFPERENRQVDPAWGFVTRWAENESGGYWDFCDFPLLDAGEEELAAWPVPSPDDFDVDEAIGRLAGFGDYAVILGGTKYVDIINAAAKVRGTEQVLVDMITGDEAFLDFVDRRLKAQFDVFERVLDKAAGRIDVLFFGDDLGTQRGPLISLDLYREVIKPRHKPFCDLAKAYGAKVMVHSCGSSSFAFDDFAEIGVDVVDTLQPEAVDMGPAHLKERYGGKLAFHGCISTAGPLAYGSVEDVRNTVRDTFAIMKPGGGYCMSPTHTIQDNTPVENVKELYRASLEYGAY
jgi:uroporphyrinogen decarboxylase